MYVIDFLAEVVLYDYLVGISCGPDCLYALKYLKERGLPLRYSVRAILGSNEETGMGDVRYYLDNYGLGYLEEDAKASGTADGSREVRVDISDIIQFGAVQIAGCPDSLLIMKALDRGVNAITSSSMGRLFDGVSALLGIKDYNDYEGQCAIMLEDAAAFAQRHPGEDRASDLALSFHERIIDMIVCECETIGKDTGATQVALTGGTFQNKILMEGVVGKLRAKGFDVYYNISVSPNDGGIALGQAFIGLHRLSEKG